MARSLSDRRAPNEQAPRYFVRDDDVGALTDELHTFVETFVSRRIPVSYQIIPALLTEPCASFLKANQDAHPDLIELGQHGLNHMMEVGSRRLNREFGPERTFAQQKSDIQEGMALLKRRLGADRRIVVFTPPEHKYNRDTVVAAATAGHVVFSAASYPTIRHRIVYALGRRMGLSSIRHHGISYYGRRRPEAEIKEMSIAIAVDDGGAIQQRAGDLEAAIEWAGKRLSPVGLMFHHAVYRGADGRAALLAIADKLAGLGSRSFVTLAEHTSMTQDSG